MFWKVIGDGDGDRDHGGNQGMEEAGGAGAAGGPAWKFQFLYNSSN